MIKCHLFNFYSSNKDISFGRQDSVMKLYCTSCLITRLYPRMGALDFILCSKTVNLTFYFIVQKRFIFFLILISYVLYL